MSNEDKTTSTRIVHLAASEQVVINGALVTARQGCSFEIGTGAFVLTGGLLRQPRDGLRSPSDELYFSLLDCGSDEGRFASARFRMFELLGEVVARERTHEAQRECSQCAAALMAGDSKAAVESAARLASRRLQASMTQSEVAIHPAGNRQSKIASAFRANP